MSSSKSVRLKLKQPIKEKSTMPRSNGTTPAQWDHMMLARSCKTVNDTGHKLHIKEFDDVLVHSKEDTTNIWLARVIGIRFTEEGTTITFKGGKDRVWVQVLWYYSAHDIGELHPSVSGFAPNERALSDDKMTVALGCVIGHTVVHPWKEDDLDPPRIGPESFFLRSRYCCESGILSPAGPTAHACQICKVPYNPFPPERQEFSTANTTEFMHFCPRPHCRRWYHRKCLLGHYEEVDQGFVGPRGIRLLAVDPDLQHPHVMFKKYLDRRPHRGKMSEDTTEPVKQLLNELAYGLKPGEPGFEGTGLGTGIVQMAMQPIVRPLDTPGTEFNVTGNVRDVVLARRFVYQLCERWHYILPQVEAMQSRLDSALSDMDDDGILAFDIDDALSSRRLLASPYMPYWTARGTMLAQSDWLSSSPAVICPGCGGAI